MKRILFILASVACVLAGCTLEPAEGLLNSNAPVFTASFADGGATRTQLADNQTSVLWSDGDEISVFDGNGANHEYLSSGPGKVTVFSLKGSETVEPASEWIAIYPYNPDAERSPHSNLVTTILKSEYTQSRPGTFADGMNLAIAQTADASLNLSFKNALGYIAVAIKGASDVTRLTFRGNNDDGVAGPVNIPFDLVAFNFTGKPTIPVSKTLTLNIQNFEESASKEAPKYYYLPVLPGYAFQKGFSIDITKGDGDYTYTYDKTVTFTRGEKRALFIEIPGGGGDDNYIDLVNEPLKWVVQTSKKNGDPLPPNWDDKHRIYPTTHADIAYAEWTWNNGAEPRNYVDKNGTAVPILDVNDEKYWLRIRKGLFDDDALLFTVPVNEIPASKTLSLTFSIRGGAWIPAYWTTEVCLDGNTWNTMDVPTGYNKDGTIREVDAEHPYPSTGKQYEGRSDGQTYTAPIYITKKDSEHVYRATWTLTEKLPAGVLQFRIRILIARKFATANPSGEITSEGQVMPFYDVCNNASNCHLAFTEYTLGGIYYPGPCISVL